MKKVYLSALALFFALTFWVSAGIAAPMLHMDIDGYAPGVDDITVKVCETFTFDLWLSEAPTPGIINWYHDIVLDPLVEVVDVHIKSEWDSGDYKIKDGKLEMSGFVFGDPVYGSEVSLANITFHCIGFGETVLSQAWHFDIPENFVLENGTAIDESMGFSGTDSFAPLTIHVNQVPIPGAVLLFGSGLLGLMGIGRRRMKKS